jgi:hypothetical protein
MTVVQSFARHSLSFWRFMTSGNGISKPIGISTPLIRFG